LPQSARKAFSPLRSLIEQGIKEGTFRSPSVDVAALAAWSLVHGFAFLVLDRHVGQPEAAPAVEPEQLASQIIALFQQGLLKE